MQVPMAPTPVLVEGTLHLVYELHLTNFSGDSLVPVSVDVFDVARGSLVTTFGPDALAHRLALPGATSGSDNGGAIAPGTRGVIYLELALPTGTLPKALEHRIGYAIAGDTTRASFTVTGGRTQLGNASPAVLGAPLRGGPWAAIHDPSWPRGHRRVLYAVDGRARIPGRFAIDWVKLDKQGRAARGDADQVRNAYGYGAEVLAVADAVVASTRDDVTESASIAAQPKHALADAAGNYVSLDLGHGRYAFYEHLKLGSVRVKPGQRVRRGDMIGALGFSGDSTGPHLHFHVADADAPLGAEGLPFVLERVEVLGEYRDIGTLGKAPWTPLDDASSSPRTHEYPAPNVVVEFP